MAGVKGMRNRASTSPVYANALRARIDAPRILKRLTDHIDGEIEMGTSQVTAAIALLRKTMPDLAQTTISGDPDNPVLHSLTVKGIPGK